MSENLPEKRPAHRPGGSTYSQADKEYALTFLVFARGPREAEENLKKDGKLNPSPNHQTLQRWRDHAHTDMYLQIRERTQAQREAMVIARIDPIIDQAFEVTAKALTKLDEQLDRDEVKDPAGAARNAATTGAILVDKKMAFEGRPTSVIKHLSGEEALRKLSQYGVKVIDGTAELVDDMVDKT